MGTHGALLSQQQQPTDRGTKLDGWDSDQRTRPCRPGARRAGRDLQGYSRLRVLFCFRHFLRQEADVVRAAEGSWETWKTWKHLHTSRIGTYSGGD